MKRTFFLCALLAISNCLFAQQKKSTKQLEAQVKKAKAEEAASKSKDDLKATKPFATVGSNLLPFQLISSEEIRVTNESLPAELPLLLVLFNPQCDHCEAVAKEIVKHKDEFTNVSILFVCGMNLQDQLTEFVNRNALAELPNVKVCAAPEDFTQKIFLSRGIPQLMCYDRNKVLQKIFFDKLELNDVLHELNKSN